MLDTYFIHFTPLVDRFANYQSLCHQITQPVTLITEEDINIDIVRFPFSKDTLFEQLETIYPILVLHQLYCSNSERLLRLIKFDYLSTLCDISSNNTFFASIYNQALSAYSSSNFELSCQHYEAITRFVTSKTSEYCLILEDDSVFTKDYSLFNNVLSNLTKASTSLPFFLDVSNSLGLSQLYASKLTNSDCNIPFFRVLSGQTRCSSAYIINRSAAILILLHKHFILPIVWHLSYVLSLNHVNTYWSTNPLFLQGSQVQLFTSNLTNRNS